MKIAIDVDNTITNTFSKMVEYCELYNNEVLKRNIKRNGVGSSQKMYNWTDEEQINFAINYFPKYALELNENSKEIINRLSDNHEIHILTARTENLNPKIKGITC
jgi:5'(3')-deoxyribonucleotidase